MGIVTGSGESDSKRDRERQSERGCGDCCDEKAEAWKEATRAMGKTEAKGCGPARYPA